MGDSSTIIIAGRLAGDPDSQYTDSGTLRTTFSIPTHRKYNDHEVTTWHRITVWGKSAEACQQYLRKGSVVQVTGRLEPDRQTGNPRLWRDNDGQARASYDITARQVDFLHIEDGGSQQQQQQPRQQQPQDDWTL